jgi:methylmalonyl-CoA mutase
MERARARPAPDSVMVETTTPRDDSFPGIGDHFAPVEYATWGEAVEADLGAAGFDKRLVTKLTDGIAVGPLDAPDHAAADAPGAVLPGPEGWEIAQLYEAGAPEALNAELREDVAGGVTHLLLPLDAAGRRGLDPDAAGAGGRVGVDGCAIVTADDLRAALAGIPDGTTVTILAGDVPDAAQALAAAVAEERPGLSIGAATDPFATALIDGGIRGDIPAAQTRLAEAVVGASPGAPRPIRLDATRVHDAGGTPTQEVAYVLAALASTLRSLETRELPPERVAEALRVAVAVDASVFVGIAKLRALRIGVARILEVVGVPPELRTPPIEAVTSLRMMTARDPWSNMLRTTIAGFAAAAGGAGTLVVRPFDAALGIPDGFARRIARNTGTILAEESHLTQVADPAAGSWSIDRLTSDLAESAWAAFQAIDADGGLESAIQGRLQADIAKSEAAVGGKLAKRRPPIIGVSEFAVADEKLPVRPRVDPVVARDAAIRRLPESRQAAAPDATIAERIAAAKAGASIGALATPLPGDDGVVPTDVMPVRRASAPFERLRDAADAAAPRPAAFLANLGPVAVHTARAGFATNLLRAGGFAIVETAGFSDPAAAASAFAESGAPIAVICSSDDVYAEQAAPTATALRDAGAKRIVVAGRPGDAESAWRDAGVTDFIFLGCDVLTVLRDLLGAAGVDLGADG